MNDQRPFDEWQQMLIAELVAEYRRCVEAGEKVDREALLLRYPQVADALWPSLEKVDLRQRTSAPVVENVAKRGSRPELPAGQSLRSLETVAPRGMSDSAVVPSGPFPSLPVAFGRYRVEKLLGSGMMGAVSLARDTQLDRPVALKVPRLTGHEDSDVIARLQREARAGLDESRP